MAEAARKSQKTRTRDDEAVRKARVVVFTQFSEMLWSLARAGVMPDDDVTNVIGEMIDATRSDLREPYADGDEYRVILASALGVLGRYFSSHITSIDSALANTIQLPVSNTTGRDWLQKFGLSADEAKAYLPEFERATAGLVRAFREKATNPQPALAKPIYADSDKSRDPVTFYREEWADEIAAGTITQALVRSVDPGLIKNMRELCRRRGWDAAKLLPPAGKSGRPLAPPLSADEAIHRVQTKRTQDRRRPSAKT